MQLGDYILKSEVQSREGSAQYREMAEYANRMGYVIVEGNEYIPPDEGSVVFDDFMYYTEEVYRIVEPPQPEPLTRKEELEAELAEIEQRFDELAYIGTKIATGRGTKKEYAKQIEEMQTLADRKNAINIELAEIDKKEEEKMNETSR